MNRYNNMDFTIWVTRRCNLSCKYCYEGNNKLAASMDIKTADKTIEFICKTIKKVDENINVIFHGGEPLLEYDLIKYFIKSLKENIDTRRINFGITTNGTIINDEIYKTLVNDFKYSLTISIDGNKLTHDLNRKYINGNGSYDEAIRTAVKLLKVRPDLRVRMTINTETVDSLYENILSLIENGFNYIAPSFDYYDKKWSLEKIKIIENEMKKIDKFINRKENIYSKIKVGLVDKDLFMKQKSGLCNGGYGAFNIDVNGDIYPCSVIVGDSKLMIGDIYTGIDYLKVETLKKIYSKENSTCYECSYKEFCTSNRCKLINKSLTGNFLEADPVVCNIENIKYKILKKYTN